MRQKLSCGGLYVIVILFSCFSTCVCVCVLHSRVQQRCTACEHCCGHCNGVQHAAMSWCAVAADCEGVQAHGVMQSAIYAPLLRWPATSLGAGSQDRAGHAPQLGSPAAAPLDTMSAAHVSTTNSNMSKGDE